MDFGTFRENYSLYGFFQPSKTAVTQGIFNFQINMLLLFWCKQFACTFW